MSKKEQLNVLLINSVFKTMVWAVNENNIFSSTLKHHLITIFKGLGVCTCTLQLSKWRDLRGSITTRYFHFFSRFRTTLVESFFIMVCRHYCHYFCSVDEFHV